MHASPDVNTIRFGYAAVNGLSLHYAESGQADRPLILFLHGFPEFWYCWRAQLQLLGADYHCVAPDLPGYNLSSHPAEVERYRTGRLVDDVIAFAQQFAGQRKFTVVAHDWGGALAWALAIKRPDLLDRLVIINAVHPGAFRRELALNPDQAKASGYIQALRSPDAEERYARNDFELLWASFAEPVAAGHLGDLDRAHYIRAWAQPGALTGMLNWYRAMPPLDSSAADRAADSGALRVETPTLVIWGMGDEAFLPGCLDGLERWAPGVEIHRVPGASHWIIHEEPEFVGNLIADWLDRQALRSW